MKDQIALPATSWYLIQSKPRQEGYALEHLNRQGFECFFPQLEHPPKKTGKAPATYRPLFPGYLFIYLKSDDNWGPLRSTRGVSKVVAFNGRPCSVDESVIEQLKARHAHPPKQRTLTPGQKIHIENGPLADMDAIFLSMDGEQRVLLLLDFLNRQQRIKMPLANISAAGHEYC